MPGWESLFGRSQMLGELAQYPDVNLYNAAAKLKAEDRPSVPVRLLGEKSPILRIKPKTEGVPDFANNQILINPASPNFQNPYQLGGIMAHEMEHMRRGKNDQREHPAYRRQYEALERAGFDDPIYMKNLRDRLIGNLAHNK